MDTKRYLPESLSHEITLDVPWLSTKDKEDLRNYQLQYPSFFFQPLIFDNVRTTLTTPKPNIPMKYFPQISTIYHKRRGNPALRRTTEYHDDLASDAPHYTHVIYSQICTILNRDNTPLTPHHIARKLAPICYRTTPMVLDIAMEPDYFPYM